MIDEIHIRDVALIHEAHLVPHEALTVITGETGTGKTALLNALKLLIGERFDASLVREGCAELKVEGRFFFDGNEDDGTVVSRRVGTQGRSRVSIDGSLASVKELAQRVGSHVDLCGQHEHQHLLSLSYQRELFDAWAGEEVQSALRRYRACFDEATNAQQHLEYLRDLASADSVELDRARFALDQINEVAPEPGEYEDLQAQLPRLEHAELLMNESMRAQSALSGQSGALEKLEEALSCLDRVVAVDTSAEGYAQAMREAYFTLEDVARSLASYRDGVEYSPEDLEVIQGRLASLQGLMRGFGPRMEDVFDLRKQSEAKLAEYESRDELIAQAQIRQSKAEQRLQEAARALRAARLAAAPRFSQALGLQFARLEMRTARLEACFSDLEREQWDSWGPHTCEFRYAAGEGMKLRRLNKVASGGEMSRIMLALKVVLGACDRVETLVFDEIDAGVGGLTARSLAEVLVDLSKTHQVLVVTHLPQVAVCGDVHYVVTKTNGAHPETHLTKLSGDARIAEIARMLAGEINDVSLAHAQELLDERKR